VCLYSTDDVVPFGCLATCIAVEEDHWADGRKFLKAKFKDIEGTFWHVQKVLEERGIEGFRYLLIDCEEDRTLRAVLVRSCWKADR
jgi:hypothetical protein